MGMVLARADPSDAGRQREGASRDAQTPEAKARLRYGVGFRHLSPAPVFPPGLYRGRGRSPRPAVLPARPTSRAPISRIRKAGLDILDEAVGAG